MFNVIVTTIQNYLVKLFNWQEIRSLLPPFKRGVSSPDNFGISFKKPVVLIFLLCVGSGILGQGIAGAMDNPLQIAQVNPQNSNQSSTQRTIQEAIANTPTIDVIPKRYEQSLEVYLANCSTCHLALPAELFPRQTWQRLLESTNQHYGAQLPFISGIEVSLMWNYLGTFARNAAIEDRIPFQVRDSRFFKALHPGVKFPEPAKVTTCISCHPSAAEFNYRRLQDS